MSRFLAVILTLQAAVLLLILLDGFGLAPLCVRQIVTFLFYSYVPGLVLLRVLRVHRLGAVLTALVSVSMSLVIMMLWIVLNFGYLELNGLCPSRSQLLRRG